MHFIIISFHSASIFIVFTNANIVTTNSGFELIQKSFAPETFLIEDASISTSSHLRAEAGAPVGWVQQIAYNSLTPPCSGAITQVYNYPLNICIPYGVFNVSTKGTIFTKSNGVNPVTVTPYADVNCRTTVNTAFSVPVGCAAGQIAFNLSLTANAPVTPTLPLPYFQET